MKTNKILRASCLCFDKISKTRLRKKYKDSEKKIDFFLCPDKHFVALWIL